MANTREMVALHDKLVPEITKTIVGEVVRSGGDPAHAFAIVESIFFQIMINTAYDLGSKERSVDALSYGLKNRIREHHLIHEATAGEG